MTNKLDYSTTKVPTTYWCTRCCVSGVKLWRQQDFLGRIELLCAKCSGEAQGVDTSSMELDGTMPDETLEGQRHDDIGQMVRAIPHEKLGSYWAHRMEPLSGIQWWRRLPNGLE